jgi:hypothetical protein
MHFARDRATRSGLRTPSTGHPRKQGMRHDVSDMPSLAAHSKPVCKVIRHSSGARKARDAHAFDARPPDVPASMVGRRERIRRLNRTLIRVRKRRLLEPTRVRRAAARTYLHRMAIQTQSAPQISNARLSLRN